MYSHLSNKRGGWNKRGVGAKDAKSLNMEVEINVEVGIFFEKFHLPQKIPPSIPGLLELCTSFFQKIPPSTIIPTSTFSDLATFAPPSRLFQPPRLLKR